MRRQENPEVISAGSNKSRVKRVRVTSELKDVTHGAFSIPHYWHRLKSENPAITDGKISFAPLEKAQIYFLMSLVTV
jgi:hypothetical protein